MDESRDSDNFSEDELFEEIRKFLKSTRRFELSETQDELFTEMDEADEFDVEFLEIQRPESLEDLSTLLLSEFDAVTLRQIEGERRVLTAFYIFGIAGMIVSAVSGITAIIAFILLIFLKLLGTPPQQ